MASSSSKSIVCEDREQETEALLEVFEEIIEWRSHHEEISMSGSDLLAGIKDLKMGHNSDLDPESYTIVRQELGKLFKVPMLREPVDREELLAEFINLLLLLLEYGIDWNVPFEDGIGRLLKELSSLVEDGIQGCLLAEAEAVANEAGSLVHYLIFPIQDRKPESVDEAIGVLLRQTDLLKQNIIKFSNLLEVFEARINWRSSPDLIQDDDKIYMSGSDLLAGIKDLLSHNSNLGPESYTILRQELEELFKMPKLQKQSGKDKPLEKKEILAAFINFLLQSLYLNVPSGDRMDSLSKELRFLVAVLGDPMVAGAELEQVHSLMAEFETVANEAGSLVHSLIFPSFCLLESVDEAHIALLRQIDLLKHNIIEFSNHSRGAITRKASAVESLFIIDSLIYDIHGLMIQEGTPIVDVKDLIKTLHSELMFWQSFLNDLKVPLSEMEELKVPAMQVRDAAYEAEYLINSFVVGDIPQWYINNRLSNVIHKIKLTGSGLQELKKISEKVSLQTKKTFEVDDIIIVGFEDRATGILDQLIGGTQQLQTICIFGMPGLGKTTLAKKLCNHPLVNHRFDKCSWGVVSQNYKRRSLLTSILIDLENNLDKDKILKMEEESLAEHIYQTLIGRRYLIVMDDIWDSNVWDGLRRYFPNDGNGSRILFTSRNKHAAPPQSIIHELLPLSNDECWELLQERVFRNNVCPTQLLEVGKKIAAQCCGLPLAVVVVAGILSTLEEEESSWENVERSLPSYVFADSTGSVRQVLELSYKHLPDYLKPCFLYLVFFVGQHEIQVQKLKRLWIAEGFISQEEKNSDSVAEKYLMELVAKSLVIVSKRRSDGGVKSCVIHDLLREFCLGRVEDDNFLKLMDSNYSIYEKHHHLSGKFHVTLFGLHVRSLFGQIERTSYFVSMKSPRILDLRARPDYILRHLNGIEALIHLRYLAFPFAEIPKSIASLVNLEFLIVNSLGKYIPSVLLEMPKLRFLHIDHALFENDCNCSLTNNLESLSNICIYSLEDEEMLKCSSHLRKLKCQFQRLLVNERAYRYLDLRFLTELESLNLTQFNEDFTQFEIYFPSSIKKLTLSFLYLPWENMSTIGALPNLEVLKLRYNAFDGERWDTRDDEFQQLRFLELRGSELVQWNVSSEHFPKLQQLRVERCSKLQEIPFEMGQIDTLQLIEVKWCQNSVVDSAIRIQDEQREMGNEELKVIIIRWQISVVSSNDDDDDNEEDDDDDDDEDDNNDD